MVSALHCEILSRLKHRMPFHSIEVRVACATRASSRPVITSPTSLPPFLGASLFR